MKFIDYNKKHMFFFFKEMFLDKGIDINSIANELNINRGTIVRWIDHKEVPPQYFTQLNKISGFNFKLNVDEKTNYKVYDMFFTPQNEAKRLMDYTLDFIKDKWDLNLSNYTIIEPSAGSGSFSKSIPKEYKKIALDIKPQITGIKKQDFFDFLPKTKNNIVIGNPPFGLRGNLALRFINHAAKFSDFICFVLPPLFNSNGKGSPMTRIDDNFYLAKEIKVQDMDFEYPNGEKVTVNSIFQIWTKIHTPKVKPIAPPNKISENIKVISLSVGKKPSQNRNISMIDKCDLYLPSTSFNDFKPYKSFSLLPHNRGYGVIYLKNKSITKEIEKKIDWSKAFFKSTNGANNLRSQIIIDSFEKGFKKWKI